MEFDNPLATAAIASAVEPFEPTETATPHFMTEPEMQRRIRDNLWVVLQKTGWKIKGANGAAELLGVKPTTLISRIKKLGLKREDLQPSLSREAKVAQAWAL